MEALDGSGKDVIGVGIVGLGDGGMSNFKALLGIPGVEVIALYDINRSLAETRESESGVPACSSAACLMADQGIDLVVVATPDHLHLGPAELALEAGKYVFVEKPVATSISALEAFLRLAIGNPGKMLFSEKYSFAHPVQAALALQNKLGAFMTGVTAYSMWKCGRIMGGGKWRTEMAYNPCAGGLSHNFMTALLFSGTPIVQVRATGQVLTYHENLDRHGGFDAMEGTLEFANGRRLSWFVNLAVQTADSPYAHRTVAHVFQFERGALAYGPTPESDRLIVNGKILELPPERSTANPWADHENPELGKMWADYNIGVLYRLMWENILASVRGEAKPLHTIEQGINVAAACALAFESAHQDGIWLKVPF